MKIRALALMILLSGGALSSANAQWPLGRDLNETASSESSGRHLTGGGRFQLFITPQAKASTFMVDTESGRLWIMKKDSSSGEYSLSRVPVEGINSTSTPRDAPNVSDTKSGDAAGKP